MPADAFVHRASSSAPVELLSMAEGEEWLLRPVRARMCSYEALVNGVLSLEDVLVMNEALDVEEENTARLRAYYDSLR